MKMLELGCCVTKMLDQNKRRIYLEKICIVKD
jgi:hypothetical protein